MNLLSQAKKLPLRPGVYLFINKKERILYIGRATSLKRRVLQYFQKNLDPRIQEMVNRAIKLKFYQTESLLEAIILEANLIKKYWPKYNIKDRDDRSFVYIVIPKTDYSYPLVIRQHELNKFLAAKAYVFGPYQSLSLIQSALKIVRRIFPWSTCQPLSGKRCFDSQIGLCPGLCVGEINKKDYQTNIKNIILLLRGEKKKLFKRLAKDNSDKLLSLKHIQDVALISQEEITPLPFSRFNRIEGYDISHLTGKETFGSMTVFNNGEPDRDDYRLFKIKEAPPNDDLRALEEMFLRRFRHLEWRLPDVILIDGGKPQINYISKILEKRRINIPLVGISKFANNKLVFAAKTKKPFKVLAEANKTILLKIRDEAHRFANRAHRRRRIKENFKKYAP